MAGIGNEWSTVQILDFASLHPGYTLALENALQYGEAAEAQLVEERTGVEIHIDDLSPGIPEDQLEEVFMPFVRLETSRNRETGGTGLGL